jgi:hypothetical protein
MPLFPAGEALREAGAEQPQPAAQELQEKARTRHAGISAAKNRILMKSSFQNQKNGWLAKNGWLYKKMNVNSFKIHLQVIGCIAVKNRGTAPLKNMGAVPLLFCPPFSPNSPGRRVPRQMAGRAAFVNLPFCNFRKSESGLTVGTAL